MCGGRSLDLVLTPDVADQMSQAIVVEGIPPATRAGQYVIYRRAHLVRVGERHVHRVATNATPISVSGEQIRDMSGQSRWLRVSAASGGAAVTESSCPWAALRQGERLAAYRTLARAGPRVSAAHDGARPGAILPELSTISDHSPAHDAVTAGADDPSLVLVSDRAVLAPSLIVHFAPAALPAGPLAAIDRTGTVSQSGHLSFRCSSGPGLSATNTQPGSPCRPSHSSREGRQGRLTRA